MSVAAKAEGTRIAAPGSDARLGERDALIFRAIVEDYIKSGELVGSQSVAPRCEVSPATVRNVMADLEAQGLLEKPHTSAGRRPTDAGYRYYVDALVTVREPGRDERKLIEVGCAEKPPDGFSRRPRASCTRSPATPGWWRRPAPSPAACARSTSCASATGRSWRWSSPARGWS